MRPPLEAGDGSGAATIVTLQHMEPVEPDKRAQLLRPLLPSEPEPGTQAGFHFLHQTEVGEAFIASDRSSGLVFHGVNAWIYGEATYEVGAFLLDQRFGGTVSGAVSSIDPAPALSKYEDVHATGRTIWEADRNFEGPDFPDWFETRPIEPRDRPEVLKSQGRWVFELWKDPVSADFALVAYAGAEFVGMAGAYTLSDGYAELAVWMGEKFRGFGITYAGHKFLTDPMIKSGRRLTWFTKKTNTQILRALEKIGWQPFGEERSYIVGDRLMRARTLQQQLKRITSQP